jgi:hypothetical protein
LRRQPRLLRARKLSLFITDLGYQRAIYLIYGYNAEATLGRVQAIMMGYEDLAPIELWVHGEPGSPAKRH